MEMRVEVVSSLGAQNTDTSGHQASNLEDIEFHWETTQLEVDAVFRQGIDTPVSRAAFDNLEKEGSVENLILLDTEDYKEKSPPITPVSERHNRLPALLCSRPFGTRMENVPE